MKSARELFDDHMGKLRVEAAEQGLPLSEILGVLIDNQLFTLMNGGLEEQKRLRLFENRYRSQFYEWLADVALEGAEARFKDNQRRRAGGKLRHEGSAAKKLAAVQLANELLAKGRREYGLNKAVAKELGLEVDFVRRARKGFQKVARSLEHSAQGS